MFWSEHGECLQHLGAGKDSSPSLRTVLLPAVEGGKGGVRIEIRHAHRTLEQERGVPRALAGQADSEECRSLWTKRVPGRPAALDRFAGVQAGGHERVSCSDTQIRRELRVSRLSLEPIEKWFLITLLSNAPSAILARFPIHDEMGGRDHATLINPLPRE
jgi:hypothetical protein